jgi:hypothetical protein
MSTFSRSAAPRADAAMDDVDLDLVGGELGEGIRQRLRGPALVGLDDHTEGLDFAHLDLFRQIFQRDSTG